MIESLDCPNPEFLYSLIVAVSSQEMFKDPMLKQGFNELHFGAPRRKKLSPLEMVHEMIQIMSDQTLQE